MEFQFYFFNFHSDPKPLALCQWLRAPLSFPLAGFIIFLVQFWQEPIHHWPPMHHSHDTLLWWFRLEMGRIILQHESNLNGAINHMIHTQDLQCWYCEKHTQNILLQYIVVIIECPLLNPWLILAIIFISLGTLGPEDLSLYSWGVPSLGLRSGINLSCSFDLVLAQNDGENNSILREEVFIIVITIVQIV